MEIHKLRAYAESSPKDDGPRYALQKLLFARTATYLDAFRNYGTGVFYSMKQTTVARLQADSRDKQDENVMLLGINSDESNSDEESTAILGESQSRRDERQSTVSRNSTQSSPFTATEPSTHRKKRMSRSDALDASGSGDSDVEKDDSTKVHDAVRRMRQRRRSSSQQDHSRVFGVRRTGNRDIELSRIAEEYHAAVLSGDIKPPDSALNLDARLESRRKSNGGSVALSAASASDRKNNDDDDDDDTNAVGRILRIYNLTPQQMEEALKERFMGSGASSGGSGGGGDENGDGGDPKKRQEEELKLKDHERLLERMFNVERKRDFLDVLVLTILVLHTVVLACWDPLNTDSTFMTVVQIIDYTFTCFYGLEMILRVYCLGFIIFRHDWWICFDLIIVLVSIASLIPDLFFSKSSFSLSTVRVVRVTQSLRSLRQVETAKVMLVASFNAIAKLKDVGLLLIMFLLMFGVGSVSQYSSRLRTRCVNRDFYNSTRQAELRTIFNGTNPFTNIKQYVRFQEYDEYLRQKAEDELNHELFKYTCQSILEQYVTSRDPNYFEVTTTTATTSHATTTTTTTTVTTATTTSTTTSVNATPTTTPVTASTTTAPPPTTAIPAEDFYLIPAANRTLLMNCSLAFNNSATSPTITSAPTTTPTAATTTTTLATGTTTAAPPTYPYSSLVTLAPKNPAQLAALSGRATKIKAWEVDLWASQTCDGTDALALKGMKCPYEYACVEVANPFYGFIGFDNIGQAMLTLFITVTLEGWQDFARLTASAVDQTANLFFLVVIVLGSFFIFNLSIVLITIGFEACVREEWELRDRQKRRLKKEKQNSVWVWYERIVRFFMDSRPAPLPKSNDLLMENPLIRLRFQIRRLLESPYGVAIVQVLILTNVMVLAVQHDGMGESYVDASNVSKYVFTVIYTIELAVRFFAYNSRSTLVEFLNMVDSFVVFFGWIDIIVVDVNFRPVSALRLFRTLELLGEKFPRMQKWILVVVASLKSSLVLGVMSLFAVFVFAILGLYLFGGRFCGLADGSINNIIQADNRDANCLNRPRANYDSIGNALLSTFIILAGDGWTDIMYDAMRSRSEAFFLYFVIAVILLHFILVNLLIGIFLSVRDLDDDLLKKYDDEEEARLQASATAGGLTVAINPSTHIKSASLGQSLKRVLDTSKVNKLLEMAYGEQTISDLDPRYSSFQRMLQRQVESFHFNIFIVVVILISCVFLALESPIRAPDTKEEYLLLIGDIVTNSVFALEAILKILAYGFLTTPQSYMRRSKWNIFDLLLVLIGFTSMALYYAKKGDRTQPILSALRVLRAMRPLKFVGRSPGLKLVVDALLWALRPLFFLFVIVFTFATVWGIMGVQWFAGTFSNCYSYDMARAVHIYATRTDCEAAGLSWRANFLNFDNIGAAYLSLFALTTLEGWAEIMWAGLDSVSVGQAPIVMYSGKFALYFTAYVTIGGFFFMNLLVSIIADAYSEISQQYGRSKQPITPQQQAWVRSHGVLLRSVRLMDYDTITYEMSRLRGIVSHLRNLSRTVTRHPIFDVCVYGIIIINFIVLAIDHYPKTSIMSTFITSSNVLFAILFVLEAGLRIFSEGFRAYMMSSWNRFDFVIAVASLLSAVLELSLSRTTFVATFRTMRILRLLRLVRKNRRLQTVLKRFLYALFALKNVGAMLLLMVFIFSVAGMRIFGRVVWGADIHHGASYGDIFGSMMLTMRCVTGGDWPALAAAAAVTVPECSLLLDNCGPPNGISIAYYVILQSIGQLVLVNLFIAVIFDLYQRLNAEERVLSSHDASQFMKLWLHFDPERTYRMESKFLITLLRHIPHSCILSMGPIPRRHKFLHELEYLKQLKLTDVDGKLELQDVIYALCEVAYKRITSENYDAQVEERANLLRIRRRERLHIEAMYGREIAEKTVAAVANRSRSVYERLGYDADLKRIEAKPSATQQAGSLNLPLLEDTEMAEVQPRQQDDFIDDENLLPPVAVPEMELPVLLERKLRDAADFRFRKEARDLYKPAVDEVSVSDRYSAQILYNYILYFSRLRKKKAEFKRKRDELDAKYRRMREMVVRKSQQDLDRMRKLQAAGDDDDDDASSPTFSASSQPTPATAPSSALSKAQGLLLGAGAKLKAQRAQRTVGESSNSSPRGRNVESSPGSPMIPFAVAPAAAELRHQGSSGSFAAQGMAEALGSFIGSAKSSRGSKGGETPKMMQNDPSQPLSKHTSQGDYGFYTDGIGGSGGSSPTRVDSDLLRLNLDDI